MQPDLFEETLTITLAREVRETEEDLNCLRRKFFAEYERLKKKTIELQSKIQSCQAQQAV